MTATTTINFTIDTVSPAAPTVTGVTNGSANNVTVSPTWTDPVGTTSTATLNGTAYIKGTAIPTNGSYALVVTSTRTANGLTSSTTLNFTIDKTLPTVDTLTLTGNTGAIAGYTNVGTITLATSGSDNTGVTGWYASESSTTPLASAVTSAQPISFTLSAGDATKTVYVWDKDAAGNVSLSRSATIIKQTVAPSGTAISDHLPLIGGSTVS
jgi:hypothetical protein